MVRTSRLQKPRSSILLFTTWNPPEGEGSENFSSQLSTAKLMSFHSISILVISYFLLLSAAHVFQDKHSFCLHMAQLGFRTVGGVSSSNLRPGILTSLFSPISHVPPLSVLSSLSHSFSFPVFTSFFG